jgi:hypothetical protein
MTILLIIGGLMLDLAAASYCMRFRWWKELLVVAAIGVVLAILFLNSIGLS